MTAQTEMHEGSGASMTSLPLICKVPQLPLYHEGLGTTDSFHRIVVSMKKPSGLKVLKHVDSPLEMGGPVIMGSLFLYWSWSHNFRALLPLRGAKWHAATTQRNVCIPWDFCP